MLVAGHTALFDISKCIEVVPINLEDLTGFFLKKYNVGSKDIVNTERKLMKAASYENELATQFDVLLWYIKAWKLTCTQEFSNIKGENNHPFTDSIYQYFCSVEQIAYDFIKGILLDTECLQYPSSVLIASVITLTIEIHFKLDIIPNLVSRNITSVELIEMRIIFILWDRLLQKLFGETSVPRIERFGHYVIERSKLIYLKVRENIESHLFNVYKVRAIRYFESSLLDVSSDSSDNTIKAEFAKDINWVKGITSK